VLIADDNADAAQTLSMLVSLQRPNWQVGITHDGAALLQSFFRHQADVVVLDIGMPGLDGFQTARAIRRICGKRCRMIAVSGDRGHVDAAARSADFDHAFAKPYAFDALLAAMQASCNA
jgi:CheY-like chemotaxis protein